MANSLIFDGLILEKSSFECQTGVKAFLESFLHPIHLDPEQLGCNHKSSAGHQEKDCHKKIVFFLSIMIRICLF